MLWTNGYQQVADGLTKTASRQVLADILRVGRHSLTFDAKANKKLTKEEKQAIDESIQNPTEKHDASQECMLVGCSRPAENKNVKYCCRKHFYKDAARKDRPLATKLQTSIRSALAANSAAVDDCTVPVSGTMMSP